MAIFTALAAIGGIISGISQASAAKKQRKAAEREARNAENKMIASGSMESSADSTGAAIELGTEEADIAGLSKKKPKRVLPKVSASSMVGGL